MATNGNDVLSTSADDEVLHGLDGDDTLTSTHNRITLFGDDGHDWLTSTLLFGSTLSRRQCGPSLTTHLSTCR